MTLLQWAWDRRDTALKGYVSIYSTKDDQYRVTTKAAQLKRRRKKKGCSVEQLGTQRGKFEATYRRLTALKRGSWNALTTTKTDRALPQIFLTGKMCGKVSSTINRGKQRLCVQDIFVLDDTVLACLNI